MTTEAEASSVLDVSIKDVPAVEEGGGGDTVLEASLSKMVDEEEIEVLAGIVVSLLTNVD